jgi:dihydrofolate reductase
MPRKLILQMHISLDGFISGSNNSLLDWINPNFSPDLNAAVSAVTANVDEMLLGRKLAEGFIPAWRSRPDTDPGVKFMNETMKTVFSSTVNDDAFGENARVLRGDVEDEVGKLKVMEGKDMITYGGVEFVQSLVKAGLVDEVYLLMAPVAIGEGNALFLSRVNLELIESKAMTCGTALMHYRLKS